VRAAPRPSPLGCWPGRPGGRCARRSPPRLAAPGCPMMCSTASSSPAASPSPARPRCCLSSNAVAQLLLRGARPAGSPPAAPALPRAGGRIRLPADTAVEVDRLVWRDGVVRLASWPAATTRSIPTWSASASLCGWTATWPTPSPAANWSGPGAARSLPSSSPLCAAPAPPAARCRHSSPPGRYGHNVASAPTA
jgi:hypothetical protein